MRLLLTLMLTVAAALPAQAGSEPDDHGGAAQELAATFVAQLQSQLKGGRLVEFSVSCNTFVFQLPQLPGQPPPPRQSPCSMATAKVQSVDDPYGVDTYKFTRDKLTGPEPDRLFRRMTQEDLEDCLLDLGSVDPAMIPTLAQDATSRVGGQLSVVTLSRGCDTGPPLARSPYQGPNEARWRVTVRSSRSHGTIWYDLAGNVRSQSLQ